MKTQFNLFIVILLVLFIFALSGCALRGERVPNPSKSTSTAIQTADNELTLLLAAIQPAEVEYTSKVMKPDVEKLYLPAVQAYNQARELMRIWRETVNNGSSQTYARKRFDVGLRTAKVNVGALSRARSVK